MTALYIVGGILLFFVLAALVRVSVRAAVCGAAEVTLKVLFFNIRLVPKKKKPVKLRDYEIKRFRRRRLRQIKKEEKALRKKLAKEEKKKKAGEEAEETGRETVRTWLDIAKSVVSPVLKKFGKYIYIKIDALAVIIRGSEPDRTAVAFGEAAQTFAYLSDILNENKKIVYGGECDGRYGVAVDFTGDKPSADIDVTVGMRVWQAVAIAITAIKNLPSGAASSLGIGGRKKKQKANKSAKAGEEQQNGKQHE
ncbi:MAG: hypothetical protein IKX86_07110 [Clostridia bacterium]|nr:hypothetical protein [Clostridia bacterium]